MNLSADQLRGHLAMLLFSALIAGSFSFGSLIANEVAPMAVTAFRFLMAGVLIGTLTALGPGMRWAHFQAPWRYLLLGGLFALYFVLMFEGLKTAEPVSAAAVFTLVPVISAVFGYILLRQVTTRRMALALLVAALGAVWVIFRADVSAIVAFDIGKGEFIYFIGCIAHGVYTPLLAKLNRGENPFVFTFGMLVAGFIATALFGMRDILATDWSDLSGFTWIALFYLTVFSSAASFVLLQYASMRLPAAKVMAYSYITPAWVIFWEVGFGKGFPVPAVFLGVGVVVVALLILLKDEAAL